MPKGSFRWVALLSSLCALLQTSAQSAQNTVDAQFRGCDVAGWCTFWIAPARPTDEPLHRVRPDGVVRSSDGDAISVAVRNRLNQLLSSMIHQHKHIVLHALRKLDDGTFAAAVIVNDADVAADPMLLQLRDRRASTQH